MSATPSDVISSPRIRALITAGFVTLLWSSSWILIRWGVDDEALDPLGFAALRYALAAFILLAIVAARPPTRAAVRRLDAGMVRRIVVLGLIFYGVNQGAQFLAIANQPAATTSMVLSMTPLLVAALSGPSLAERASGRQWLGATLIAVGAAFYFAGALGATVVGMIAALVNLSTNALAAVLGRAVNRVRSAPPVVVTAIGMAVGASALFATAIALEGVPTVSLRAWAIIVWLAVVNTALAFTLWNRAQQTLTATESAGINNTMLVQIALLAWWFLGEAPGGQGLIGVLLVSGGVFLTQLAQTSQARTDGGEVS